METPIHQPVLHGMGFIVWAKYPRCCAVIRSCCRCGAAIHGGSHGVIGAAPQVVEILKFMFFVAFSDMKSWLMTFICSTWFCLFFVNTWLVLMFFFRDVASIFEQIGLCPTWSYTLGYARLVPQSWWFLTCFRTCMRVPRWSLRMFEVYGCFQK